MNEYLCVKCGRKTLLADPVVQVQECDATPQPALEYASTLAEMLVEYTRRHWPVVDPNQEMIERDGNRRYVPMSQEEGERDARQRRARNKTRYSGRALTLALGVDSAPWLQHCAGKP